MIMLWLLVLTFVFSLTLNILFFAKKHVKTSETKIFSILLIVNLIGLLIEIITKVLILIFDISNYFVYIFTKIYLIYIIMFFAVFYIYVLLYCIDDKEKYTKYYKISTLTFSILAIISSLIPISIEYGYATGIAVNYTYFITGLSTCSWIFLLLKYFDKNKISKTVPLILLITIGSLFGLIQLFYPSITLVTCLHFYVLFIMYQTIENPDLKMLEEYMKNRELVEEGFVSRTNILFKVSEDIRNPIKKIKLYSDQILVTHSSHDKDKIASDISQLSNDVNNSIEKIYNISNFDKRKIKISNVSYNIYNLFNQIIYISKSKNNTMNLKYSISDAIPDRLFGDSTRLKQIICSLILNKNINRQDGLVDLDIYAITKNDMCRLIFTIQTNLCNYDLSYINSILSSEIETTYKDIDEIDNMHIDLKNVKKLVDLLGGIMLISVDEDVMTFKIVLEQFVDMDTNSEKLDKIVLKYSNKKKVLVVNDDYKELTMISNELKKNNFDVVSVMHENDCMDRLISKDKYDIVLVDDEMKDIAAVNLIEEIDKLGLDNLIKIVMLSKDKESIKKHYVDDYSFVDYLLKNNYKDEIKRLKDKYK